MSGSREMTNIQAFIAKQACPSCEDDICVHLYRLRWEILQLSMQPFSLTSVRCRQCC